jgi:hypothetical protein
MTATSPVAAAAGVAAAARVVATVRVGATFRVATGDAGDSAAAPVFGFGAAEATAGADVGVAAGVLPLAADFAAGGVVDLDADAARVRGGFGVGAAGSVGRESAIGVSSCDVPSSLHRPQGSDPPVSCAGHRDRLPDPPATVGG